MKKIALIAVACAFMAAPVLADLTVTFKDGYGKWQTGLGGEFTLDPSAELEWVLPFYADVAKDQSDVGTTGTFQTFCVEEYENVWANATYSAVLNDRAIAGGVGSAGDPLSLGAAYLYHEFQNGTLSGYEYANSTGRLASAAAVQNAIWYLEDEGGEENAYTAMVATLFGSIGEAKADNNGRYAVALLNLYEGTALRQDVLVCVPVPGAVLLGLLGMGTAGALLRARG